MERQRGSCSKKKVKKRTVTRCLTEESPPIKPPSKKSEIERDNTHTHTEERGDNKDQAK